MITQRQYENLINQVNQQFEAIRKRLEILEAKADLPKAKRTAKSE